MKIQLIRNATMRLNFGSTGILTDPLFAAKYTLRAYAGKSRNPLVDLPMPPAEAIAGVDVILLSPSDQTLGGYEYQTGDSWA